MTARSITVALLLTAAVHGYDPYHGHDPRSGCQAGVPSSDKFQPCWQSRCCSTPGFLCFKKVGANQAQCLPFAKHRADEDAPCKDDAEWLCPTTHFGPGWNKDDAIVDPNAGAILGAATSKTCDSPFSNCFESKCCIDPGTNGCFRKAGKRYAQCRPFAMHRETKGGPCVDSGGWVCPAAWMGSTPAPAKPAPWTANDAAAPASTPHTYIHPTTSGAAGAATVATAAAVTTSATATADDSTVTIRLTPERIQGAVATLVAACALTALVAFIHFLLGKRAKERRERERRAEEFHRVVWTADGEAMRADAREVMAGRIRSSFDRA